MYIVIRACEECVHVLSDIITVNSLNEDALKCRTLTTY